jgi:hypothetical protein
MPITGVMVNMPCRLILGVKVRDDKSQAFERYSITPLLKKGGITIRVNEKYSQMHNKFMDIDSSSVQCKQALSTTQLIQSPTDALLSVHR